MADDLDAAIRQRLDRYDAIDIRSSEAGGLAQQQVAALRAVLDLHQPEPFSAAVLAERFGDGRCAYCDLGAPLRVYEGELHYRPGEKRTMHDHANPDPWCICCPGSEETIQRWPCPTVRAIAAELGVEVPADE